MKDTSNSRDAQINAELRQLSTGKPHPMARRPILPIMGIPGENSTLEQPIIATHIVGNYMAVTVDLREEEPGRLFVYNWKTSHLLVVCLLNVYISL